MVKQRERKMASSTAIPCVLRIDRNSGSEPPHVGFANLRQDEDALQHFCRVWKQPLLDEDAEAGEAFNLQKWLRNAWEGDDIVALEFLKEGGAREMEARWEFRAGRVEMTSQYIWNAICVLFLNDFAAHKTAVCANPNCPAPYFIKARRSQKFCGQGPCTEYAQRQRANAWWDAHGEKWREKRNRQTRTKGRKP